MKKIKTIFSVVLLISLCTSCELISGTKTGKTPDESNNSNGISTTSADEISEPIDRNKLLSIYAEQVIELDNVYDISDYEGKNAFLVITNMSDKSQKVLKKESSSHRSINTETYGISNRNTTTHGKYQNIPYNPPAIKVSLHESSDYLTLKNIKSAGVNRAETIPEIGATKDFYAYDENNKVSTDLAKGAVLKAIGEHCYIWYVAKNGITIEDNSLKTLADAFDSIFECETYIFGTNISTDKYPEQIIAVDESTKVNIIVYDLFGDYLETAKKGAGTFGYFTANDFFLNLVGSNECEALHIDSYFLQECPDAICSTIAHEFQHLLNFVNKSLNQDLIPITYIDAATGEPVQNKTIQTSATWFNEMMSMICEDLMQSQLGLKDEDSPKIRLNRFNSNYQLGFTTWRENTEDDPFAVLSSYANAYTFGAYLLRNFGIDFIKDLATNKYIDKEAITESLKKHSEDDAVKSFDDALSKYYNVVLNPKADKYTLNKKVEKTYTDVGGDRTVKFECSAINLFDYLTLSGNYVNSNNGYSDYWYQASTGNNYFGPYILNNRYFYELDPCGMSVTYLGLIEGVPEFTLSSQDFTKSDDLIYRIVIVDQE